MVEMYDDMFSVCLMGNDGLLDVHDVSHECVRLLMGAVLRCADEQVVLDADDRNVVLIRNW